jgi:hypothetical protein
MAEKTRFDHELKNNSSGERLHPKRCETCRYFDPPPAAGVTGLCVAQFPVAIPMPGPAGQIGAASLFPPVRADQRCGKWEPELN